MIQHDIGLQLQTSTSEVGQARNRWEWLGLVIKDTRRSKANPRTAESERSEDAPKIL